MVSMTSGDSTGKHESQKQLREGLAEESRRGMPPWNTSPQNSEARHSMCSSRFVTCTLASSRGCGTNSGGPDVSHGALTGARCTALRFGAPAAARTPPRRPPSDKQMQLQNPTIIPKPKQTRKQPQPWPTIREASFRRETMFWKVTAVLADDS